MLIKIVLVENQNKNGQNNELGAQLSQASCLFLVVNAFARKGTLLARKGTTEVNKKGLKALSSSKQRGIKLSAKHELEWIKIFHSLIWIDPITSKLPSRASSINVSCRFAAYPVLAQPLCGRKSLAVSRRKKI